MKITRRQLRKIIAEATQMSAMRRYDEQSEYLGMLAHGLVVGAEQIFSVDLSEADEYEYGQDFRAILEKNPDMLELLGKIYEEIRVGNREVEANAPPLTREEMLDIAATRMGMTGSGELTEEDFKTVLEALIEDGMDPDRVNQLTYDEVLRRIGNIENLGMR